jgi:hypothetical protein
LRPATPPKPINPPFKPGDIVLDAYNKTCTVIELDPHSNHNLGKVKVRYDDGRELTYMLTASGLRLLPTRPTHNKS